ncbi:hypothetical protein P3S68_024268 [Capsicum galapagoense]
MEKIASPFVRNSANVGRNLVMAQKNSFPSDIATLFLELYATISLMTNHGIEKFTWEKLLSRPHLDLRIVLLSICKPVNASAYVNAALQADVFLSQNDILLNNIRLAFGAYGTKHATRAKKVVKSSTKYYPVGESIKKVELPCKLLVKLFL